MQVDKEAFEYAIAKIDDGNIFELFGNDFLSAVLGYSFIPVGRTKDKGVDGFQHIYSRNDSQKHIFQLSTELDHVGKIYNTIKKLQENEIEFDRLVYVTNRKINNAESLVDEVFDKTKIPLTIYDIRWFSANCNLSEQTIKAYQVFVSTYLHEYSKPGKYYTVSDLDSDSRLFVFLGQQFDSNRDDLKLDDLLADTLILYALEGTDPDKHNLKSEAQIKESIKKYLKFDPQLLDSKISERLVALSTKPRKIKFHTKEQGYCLPYETRLEIGERNLKDEALFSAFYEQTQETIKKYFSDIDVKVKDVETLITKVFNNIFLRQGLEFSNFVLKGDSHSVIEQNLNDVISLAVDESNVVLRNKEKVKTALHLAIRDIVYNGTVEQRRFLKSLSNTYLMMFLLQWEPKLSTYFQTLASHLNVFVDNSIIIPALSEYYLEEGNRRHWNLLIGAKKAGISMFINETLLNELVSHLRMVKNKYYNMFFHMEEFYLNDEFELLFIDEILIRAYFYAKKKGQIKDFDKFIDTFVDSQLRTAKEELVVYLKEIFGITFISNEMWDIKVNEDEKAKLTEVLSHKKDNDIKAENDAEMILAIYYLRNKNGESSDSGIFGYKTWWLSKDTATYKAVLQSFGPDKYPVSCYIRPDFIYNYIALKPTTEEVNNAYNEIFPTMLGVNLSYHMPKEVSQAVQEKIREYHSKPAIRVKQTLKTLSDRLKSDPTLKNRNSVEHFLDTELSKLQDGE
ncbi:MAG: hypothetical protein WHS63_06660 [Tenuifilum sp.]|uniref:hypothetical protein n=1 Tax=Tenuifilum sp. TaxID=2760880 RepID=UPI0030AD7104